jgi:hypothetical protein
MIVLCVLGVSGSISDFQSDGIDSNSIGRFFKKQHKYSKKYNATMENIRIRCKSCNKELEGHSAKTVSCGCPNMATIVNNSRITALDLNNIVMLNSPNTKQTNNVLTNEDIRWQEERRQRKVRRLDFEVR